MGQALTTLKAPLVHCGNTVVSVLSGRRKRKRDPDNSDSAEDLQKTDSQSAKKKKLLTTTQYIYKALFQEEMNSDIAVMAMGKVWKLHKVYLCQSPYFYSMFNGSWKESTQAFVHIKILDERITVDSLNAVFGSMYSDEIDILPSAVVSVLATATLFHLDGIIDKCAEVMAETVTVQTAVEYYEAGCQYGCTIVKNIAFRWLLTNLLCIYAKNPRVLRSISVELMTALVYSSDLYVMQTEFSLYTLLRFWCYLRMHPDLDDLSSKNPDLDGTNLPQRENKDIPLAEDLQEAVASSTDPPIVDPNPSFFAKRTDPQSFLATPEGREFLSAFQALRTQYLINHHMDLKVILNDNIIPKEWLYVHVLAHWNSLLKVDHLPEHGPQNIEDYEFNRSCMRFGRILVEPGYQKWRWTGFNFGLDLILIADSRVLSIRRHHRNEHERVLSLQTKRQFMIRASVTSINSERQPIHSQKSEIKSLDLEKNEEVILLIMESALLHPLLVSVNVLVTHPTPQHFKEKLNWDAEDAAAGPISEFGGNCDRPTTPLVSHAVDSALFVVPPSPPTSDVSASLPHRSTSATSTVSTTSQASASSVAHMDFP